MAAALALQARDDVTTDEAAPVAALPLSRLKRQYSDYLGSKNAEIAEQKEADRYYHGAHWTANEIKVLNDRGQPVITYNRIQRKIDAVVGLTERLRQDPKGYPRTPNQEAGAELATAVLRETLDASRWKDLSPEVANKGGVKGIGGIELGLEAGDHGDPEITISEVDPADFFYDPRSVKPDFSDARYLGVAKWLDLEAACELFPEREGDIRANLGGGGSDGSDAPGWDDKEVRWTNVRERRLRVVEHWYKIKGEWHYTFFSGGLRLEDGISPFTDEKKRTICRFIMFSCAVDHDGDRYGFVRNLKGANDEINQRRSKGLHVSNSRRIKATKGAVENIEKARKEAARADGYIEVLPGGEFEFDDVSRQMDLQANLEFLREAKAEIENFGPNPALIGQGTGVAGSSGRAIALLQQAGIAELGPFIIRYRGWKLRVYRAVWSAVQRYWTAERFIRVTDNEDLVQFIQVNGIEIGPAGPQLVNALGNLDVDIILDEGPDQVNSMADAYDTLIALSQRGAPVPPDIIVELSSLPGSLKKKILQKLEQQQQPNPLQVEAATTDLAQKKADVAGTQAKTAKDVADAAKTALEAHIAAAPFTALAEPMFPQERAFMGPAGAMPPPSAPPGALPVI